MTSTVSSVAQAPREITTGELAADPELSIVLRPMTGERGLERPIRHPRVQKSGLALAGHFHGLVPTRVQILSMSYIHTFTPRMLVELRGGYNHFVESFLPEDGSFNPATIGLNTGVSPQDYGLPMFRINRRLWLVTVATTLLLLGSMVTAMYRGVG
jgi:hypothetical protein